MLIAVQTECKRIGRESGICKKGWIMEDEVTKENIFKINGKIVAKGTYLPTIPLFNPQGL